MKKKILTLILPAVAMITAACGETKPCDHKDDNNDHICDVCNEKISEHKDENKDHKCDICAESMGEHVDNDKDHNCDYCGEEMSQHVDSDLNHKCDVCDANMGEHADKDNDHNCDYCGEEMSQHVDSDLNHKCDVCDANMGEHADNNNDHNCDYCGEEMSQHIDSDLNGKCDICGEDMEIPENRELEKFNWLVGCIKKDHNYSLTINSVVEGLEDQELNCHRYNLNDKAWFHDNSEYFEAEGIIYQKDQGYVSFIKNNGSVIPMSLADEFTYEKDPSIFVTTDPSLKISDFIDAIGENLFIGEYVQDSKDRSKFTTTNIDNRAVAAYLTQYYDYISTGQLQIANSMDAVVDVNNSTITLSLEYSLWYFDEVEVQAPGVITITLSDVASTSDEVISNYIANPSYVFTNVTSWPESMNSVFTELNNSVTPTLPSRLSYAAVCEKILYDGFYYAGIQDLNSGDLRVSYGETLVNEGFTKVSDNSYKKVVVNGVDSVTYKVIMKYDAASTLYPNGEMKILFRADKSSGVFASIADFNAYLSSKKYDELVPSLPNEDSCTSISNFKDTTDNEIYALKCNSTDTFKVNIPDYVKAQAFVNSYVNALVAKGFSDTSKFLSMTNYSLEWSTAGSYVAIDFPATAGQYTGYVGIRYVVYKVDEQSLRPSAKHSVSASSSIENGSISFGGTTEYSAGSTVNFTITPNSGYEFDSASIVGKDIQVNVVGNKGSFVMPDDDAVVLVTFKEKAPEPTHAISFVCDHFTVDHFEDEGGNVITSYIYKEDAFGIFAYGSFDEGFEFDYLTLEGDEEALGGSWFDEDHNCDVIQIYPSKALDEYNITAYTKGSSPVPTKYDVSADTSIDGGSIKNILVNGESSTEAEAGDTVRFTVSADDNYVLVADSVKVFDGKGQEVVISLAPMSQSSYTFIMPNSGVTITAEFEFDSPTPEPTMYAINKDSIEGLTIKVVGSITEEQAGEYVRFNLQLAEGYELLDVFIKDHPEIIISETLNPITGAITYSFEMPAHDVTISANVSSPAPAKAWHVEADSSMEHGSISFAGSYYDTDEKVEFLVTPNSGYQIDSVSSNPSVTITNEGNGKYSFNMPASDVVVSASFSLIPTPEPVPHTVSAVGDVYDGDTKVGRVATWYKYVEVKAGDMAYVSITPQAGYEIVRAYVQGHEEITLSDASAEMGSNKWGFEMPNYDVTITAEFRAIPKELSSISLSGQKSDFVIGEDFSVGDLVVTANYANGDKATVTGYSVDSSKVNMEVAGNYTVTVSYTEGEITKSQDYGIVVKAGEVACKEYEGSKTISSVNYTYNLKVYEDGTGVYELSNGTTTYYQYFTWTDAGSGKINIVPDANKTSELCKTTSCYANLWFYWSGDQKSNKNVITLDDSSASFPGMYYNNTSAYTISLTAVSE